MCVNFADKCGHIYLMFYIGILLGMKKGNCNVVNRINYFIMSSFMCMELSFFFNKLRHSIIHHESHYHYNYPM